MFSDNKIVSQISDIPIVTLLIIIILRANEDSRDGNICICGSNLIFSMHFCKIKIFILLHRTTPEIILLGDWILFYLPILLNDIN